MTKIDWVEYGGAMDWIKESDWILWVTITVDELPEAPRRFEDREYQINQTKIAPNICTIASSLWCIADNTDYQPTDQDHLDIMNIWLARETYKFDPSVWRWLHIATDETRRDVNNKGAKVSSLAILIGSEEHRIAEEKGYSVSTGFTGNRAHNIDRDNDGILQTGWVDTPGTFWHANRQFSYRKDTRKMIADSYLWRPTNIYEQQAQDIMLKENRHFKRGFIFFPLYIMTIWDLPKHVTREAATTPDEKNIIIAWETEFSQYMKRTGQTMEQLLARGIFYSDYTWSEYKTKMQMDLKLLRTGLIELVKKA